MDKKEYITALTEQIRCKAAREPVAEEIEGHIEDQARTYLELGIPDTEAYEKAVGQMGDPVEAGVLLDHIHRPKLEWKLLLLVLALSTSGLFLQFKIGSDLQSPNIFYMQCLYTAAGLLAMVLFYFLDYSFLGKHALLLFAAYTLLLMAIGLYVPRMNGTKLFLIMPMYLYVPLMAGIFYHFRGTGGWGLCKCIIFMLLPVLISACSIPSMQTACNLLVIFVVMLLLAVAKGWFQVKRNRTIAVLAGSAVVLPAALLLAGYCFFFTDYQRFRIISILNPNREYNYVEAAVRELIGRSSIFGSTVSMKESAAGFLPDMHSEYVFTHLVISYGFLAGILLILLFVFLVFRVFHISMRQKNQLGMMTGIGCGMVFLLECAEYILMNFGIGFATTVYLPFFSYGRTSVIVFYILTGLLLSIYRYKDILPERQPREKRRAAS